jgi:hypothetical protein
MLRVRCALYAACGLTQSCTAETQTAPRTAVHSIDQQLTAQPASTALAPGGTHSKSPSDAAPLQLALCVRVAELYPKNYFAWTHRQACSRALKAHASRQSNRVLSTAVPSAGGCERQACGVCMVCRVPRAACDARL